MSVHLSVFSQRSIESLNVGLPPPQITAIFHGINYKHCIVRRVKALPAYSYVDNRFIPAPFLIRALTFGDPPE